ECLSQNTGSRHANLLHPFCGIPGYGAQPPPANHLTRTQLDILESLVRQDALPPDIFMREEVALKINLPESKVQVRVKNRRAKMCRRAGSEQQGSAKVKPNEEESSSPTQDGEHGCGEAAASSPLPGVSQSPPLHLLVASFSSSSFLRRLPASYGVGPLSGSMISTCYPSVTAPGVVPLEPGAHLFGPGSGHAACDPAARYQRLLHAALRVSSLAGGPLPGLVLTSQTAARAYSQGYRPSCAAHLLRAGWECGSYLAPMHSTTTAHPHPAQPALTGSSMSDTRTATSGQTSGHQPPITPPRPPPGGTARPARTFNSSAQLSGLQRGKLRAASLEGSLQRLPTVVDCKDPGVMAFQVLVTSCVLSFYAFKEVFLLLLVVYILNPLKITSSRTFLRSLFVNEVKRRRRLTPRPTCLRGFGSCGWRRIDSTGLCCSISELEKQNRNPLTTCVEVFDGLDHLISRATNTPGRLLT
uniref:Orthodenticle homeobox 2a n=1 Tax=Seriola dumerili TaxID=41447 RepID=A0A3B4V1G7_SERDU